jgi:MoaA/NifB/PqqE/SkfB family radical SAM enzyme
MIDDKLILTPYLFRKKIREECFIGNLIYSKYLIKSTEEIERILSYFSDLRFIPQNSDINIELIGKLIKARILVSEKNLILPFPNIELEITNYCNSNCDICPRNKLTRKKGFMDLSIFKAILSEMKEYEINEVEICGIGEPLLHNKVCYFISELKSIGVKKVKMVTNASLLDEEKAKKLVESGIDTIMISFHTIYRDKYNEMMKGLDYDRVLSNIKSFINKYRDRVEIIITCVIGNTNYQQIDEFKLFWESVGIKNIYFQKMQSRAGNLCETKEVSTKNRCLVMDQGLFISFDGNYLSCSNDFAGKSHLGNITKTNFSKCLNNKLEMLKNQKLFEFCKYCDYDFHEHEYIKTNFYEYVKYKEDKK